MCYHYLKLYGGIKSTSKLTILWRTHQPNSDRVFQTYRFLEPHVYLNILLSVLERCSLKGHPISGCHSRESYKTSFRKQSAYILCLQTNQKSVSKNHRSRNHSTHLSRLLFSKTSIVSRFECCPKISFIIYRPIILFHLSSSIIA